jgi:EmrB/QacA subfamily drug resistance transporter
MRNRYWAVGILLLASFMDLLDATIVTVALPSIQKDLGATSAQLEWIIAGYTLAFAALLITSGRLGDIFGRKRIFIIGVIGFTLASLVSSTAATGDILVVSRVLQGAFAGVMVPQVLSIIQAMFAPKERAPIFGLTGAISGLAAVAAPLLGGALITGDLWGLGWRSIFLVNVPIGIALLIGALVAIPESKSAHPLRLDVPGVLLAMLGVLLVVYPLVEGRQLGWPAWIWALLVAAPIVFALFIWLQGRKLRAAKSPLVPTALFRSRGFSAGVITQATFQAGVGSFALALIVYLQVGLHFTALDSGLAILPYSVGAIVGTGVSIPLGAKLGKYLVALGAIVQAASLVWAIALVVSAGDSLQGIQLLVPIGIAGLGLGLEVVPLVDLALAEIPVSDAGSASGVYGTFQQVGSALGIAVVGVVFFGIIGTDFSPAVMRDALSHAAWVPVAAFTLSAIASLFLPSAGFTRQALAAKEAAEAAEAADASAVMQSPAHR